MIIFFVILNFIIFFDSGERISFCIIILFFMSVYFLILVDFLLEIFDDVVIFGLYYMLIIFFIGFSFVGIVVVFWCYFVERKLLVFLVKFVKFVFRRNERKRINNIVFVRLKLLLYF